MRGIFGTNVARYTIIYTATGESGTFASGSLSLFDVTNSKRYSSYSGDGANAPTYDFVTMSDYADSIPISV